MKQLTTIALLLAVMVAGMTFLSCENELPSFPKGNDIPGMYAVTVNLVGNQLADGTAVADKKTSEAGKTVELTATPASSKFKFTGWTVLSGDVELSDPTSPIATFTMPDEKVVIQATFDRLLGTTLRTVNTTSNDDEFGTSSASKAEAYGNELVMLTATPANVTDFVFESWEVVSGELEDFDLTANPTTIEVPEVDFEIMAIYKTKAIKVGDNYWAPTNVNEPGVFAKEPTDQGYVYQFNRKVGFSGLNAPNIDQFLLTSTDTSTTWAAENDPCPEGWRVPTLAECQNLNAQGRRAASGGFNFGTSPNQIYIKGFGDYYLENGGMGWWNSPDYANYWTNQATSATGTATAATGIQSNGNGSTAQIRVRARTDAIAVRCVWVNLPASLLDTNTNEN